MHYRRYLRLLKEHFQKRDSLFKDVNKEVREDIAEIEDVDDPVSRVAEFNVLKKDLGNLYGQGQVRKSVDKIDKEAGSLSFGTKLLVAASTYFAALPLLLLFPAISPILLPVAAAVGLGAVLVSRRLSYRAAARDAGLTPRDVRYVVKTMKLVDREDACAQSIRLDPELKGIRANLKSFHEKFSEHAAALKTSLNATLAVGTANKAVVAPHRLKISPHSLRVS